MQTLKRTPIELIRLALGTVAAFAGISQDLSAEEPVLAGSRLVRIPRSRELTPPMMAKMQAQAENAREAPWRIPDHGLSTSPDSLPGSQETEPAEPVNLQFDAAGLASAPQATAAFTYAGRMSLDFIGHDQDGRPADPMIAAGPTHLVAVVNTQIAFFTKDGTNVFETDFGNPANESPQDFFQLPPIDPTLFDPKVIFDEDSQRFFFLAISRGAAPVDGSFFHLAVSMTSDPTEGWYLYPSIQNDLDGNWVDYPGLGVSQRGLYFTGNYLSQSRWPAPPTVHRNTFWALLKAPLLVGGALWGSVRNDLNDEGPATIKPSLTHGVPAGVEMFLCGFADGDGAAQVGHVYGVVLPPDFPSNAQTWTRKEVSFNTTDGTVPDAPQMGGPALIKANNLGAQAMNAVYRSGRLWTVHHPGISGRTILRYIEYDVSDWPNLALASSADYTDLSSSYYWPAVTVNDSGDAIMCFSRSSVNEFASARWTLRFAEEGTFGSSSYLRAGEDYYGENCDFSGTCCGTPPCSTPRYRWGDYGGAAVDPVDQGFWIFHMYAMPRVGGNRRWGSWIGYIPRAVFVDGGYAGVEAGTNPRPWNTVSEGHVAALSGNDLVIRTGNYSEAVTLSKAVTIVPDGGSIIIGE